MKKLYLHCGYHKTGSSFLQTLFARNRKTLQKNGIWFPFSEGEYDMVSGNISAGNGPKLSSYLRGGKVNKSTEILETWYKEAQDIGSNTLLLSSENFFHAFADNSTLDTLISICNQLDIKDIQALIYLRDPIPHALSTYKHRAKNGNIDDFSEWLENDYETLKLLKKFTQSFSEYPIVWTCRKYSADSEFMAKSCFVDWLGLAKPVIPKDDRVNVSFTLSEIRIIKSLKKLYPNAVFYLKEEFMNLQKEEKAKDEQLLKEYEIIAANKLQLYRELIGHVNKKMLIDEKLILPSKELEELNPQKSQIIISDQQIMVISKALHKAFESEKVMGKLRNFSKRIFKRLNRLIFKYKI